MLPTSVSEVSSELCSGTRESRDYYLVSGDGKIHLISEVLKCENRHTIVQ